MQKDSPEEQKSLLTSDISTLHADSKSSLKTKTIFTLSLLSLWIPFVTSIIALAMIPSARKEIDDSEGKLQGYRMLKWAKGISWTTIVLNFVGVIMLIFIYIIGKDILVQACEINEYYCQFTAYM